MVVLEKEPDAKLGISIRGGGKGSKGNPLDKNDEGIFISKVRKDRCICVVLWRKGVIFSLFTCGRLPLEEQLIRTAV